MSRLSGIGFVALCACLIMAASANADLTSMVTVYDSYGTSSGGGHGGEFRVAYTDFPFTPASLGEAADRFEVFCVERNEYVSFGSTYYADFGEYAIKGGVGGGVEPDGWDPLSPQTAYIYSEFIGGTLTGYDYGTGTARVRSANALQNVIWYLEDEMPAGQNYTYNLNAAEAAKAEIFYQEAIATDWTDIGNVLVMNLFQNANGTGVKQDQLVMREGKKVPAPHAVALGLMGLAMIGRRFRS